MFARIVTIVPDEKFVADTSFIRAVRGLVSATVLTELTQSLTVPRRLPFGDNFLSPRVSDE
jgi:hypothetical protein